MHYSFLPFGEGNGNPLQYSYLENSMDRGTWQAAVHGITRAGHDLATSLSLSNDLLVFPTFLNLSLNFSVRNI